MNNPMYYNNFYPYQNIFPENKGLLKRGLGFMGLRSINWGNVLNNTQKTLNVINQAIPVYYQIKPIWGNAKTIFRMASALKDETRNTNNEKAQEKNTNSNEPVFFL